MIRHKVNLAAIDEERRPALVVDFVAALERLLAEVFTASQGFTQRTTWARAARAGSGPQERHDRCREARVEVSNGPDWGIGVEVSPADLGQTKLWLRTYAQTPSIAAIRRRAFALGIGVGLVVGIATSVVLWRAGWRPQNGKAFIAIPGLITMGVLWLAMTYPKIAHWRTERRLSADVRDADAVLGRAWDITRGHYAGLAPREPRRSPTVTTAATALASSAIAGLSYWAFWTIEPMSRTLFYVVTTIGLVAGLAAVVSTLFTMFDWIGIDAYDMTLKSGD